MSMSTHAVGFRQADEQWRKMKAAWEACEAVGAPIPVEVSNFFDDEPPGDKPGMEIALGDACVEYTDDMISGYEVDVSKLPAELTIIRVYNSF